MDSLKRSQKYCTQCNEKNAIRSFKCKKCGYDFPQKQKKELTSNQQSQLEQFLTKKTIMPIDKCLTGSKSPKKKIDDNTSIKENQKKSFFSSIKCLYPICNFIQVDDHNAKFLIEITESVNNKTLQIKLNNVSQCIRFSFDCLTTMTNTICLIGFLSKEINHVYYSLINIEKLSVISKHIFTYNNSDNHYNDNNFQTKDNRSYYSIIVKLIANNPFDIFIIVIEAALYCLCYNQTNNDQVQLFSINKRFPISKLDANYDSKAKTIKLLLSDSNNQIFYYIYTLDDKIQSNPKLLGVFDSHFQSKITDIRFLNIQEALSDNMTYFAACSRDGVIKIIDVNNTTVFKHKTYQAWITQLFFDNKKDILFFLTNYDDKIVGIKLSNKKEPIIKRVINTNNPQCGLVCDIDDKLYYLDYQGCVYEVKTFLIEDMFKTSKSKKKTEYEPKKICQLNNWEFTKTIKVLNIYDKDTNICAIAYDQLDCLFFTQIEVQ